MFIYIFIQVVSSYFNQATRKKNTDLASLVLLSFERSKFVAETCRRQSHVDAAVNMVWWISDLMLKVMRLNGRSVHVLCVVLSKVVCGDAE